MKCVDINMERVTKIDSTSERPEQRRRFKKLKANENQSAIQETPLWRSYLSNQHGQTVADYNNDIPVGAITLTDRYGNKFPNQTAQGNNGQVEYFTLDGHYKVLERSGSSIKVQIDGEPVWLQASFAE